ncbi:MAG: hypothetical protein AMXMBFR84_34900 [Candidatus Hydrogenedentota bacterium]
MYMKTMKRLAVVIFVVSVAAAGIAYFRISSMAATEDNVESDTLAVPVVLGKVERRLFEEAVQVPGTLLAKNFALVSPRVPGTIELILVDEGDTVIAGETELFQIDSHNLQKAVEIARQNLKVAQCSLEESHANIERTRSDLNLAEVDLARYKTLREQEVVTPETLDIKQTNYDKLLATLRYDESLIRLTQEELRKAEIALDIAEKDMRDSLVVAPLSGKVCNRMAEPGEMGSPGVPILRIVDTASLEASLFVPAQYYARIAIGMAVVRVRVGSVDAGSYSVVYKSPTIDPTLRTFEVKCDLPGDDTSIVPGGLAECTVLLDRREGLGVPTESIVQRTGQAVVFTIDNGCAKILPVNTGLATAGWTELTGDRPKEGAAVVVKGQFLLNDGSPVRPQEESTRVSG